MVVYTMFAFLAGAFIGAAIATFFMAAFAIARDG